MIREDLASPPKWALDKAVDLVKYEGSPQVPAYVRGQYATRALARHIAEHEEPPVDPLVAEAEALIDSWGGNHAPQMLLTLKALRRGIEIAKEQSV